VRCAEAITASTMPDDPPADAHAPGVDALAGRAHGVAGAAEFLLALAERTGEHSVLAAAMAQVSELAGRTGQLLPAARSGTAAPIAASWCQGLAGIGPVLLRASVILDDPAAGDLARQAGDACITMLPRLGALGRCCGAAGVGHFLIDLAAAGQQERYLQAALDVGGHMLLRSSGPPGHPVFARDVGERSATAWAFGIAGVLPFFRRLASAGT
jgi:lantibiotic modifying enzyme